MTVTACDFWHFISIVSISDVMNKTGMCGKTVKYVTSQSFSAPRWQRANQHGCAPGGLSNSTHNCFCCCFCFDVAIHIDRTRRKANETLILKQMHIF